MPRANAATDLAAKMVQVLESRRNSADAFVPVTVAELARLADPQAPPELVIKAVAGKAFCQRVLVAGKKDPNAPVALHEDAERFAASPRLLEYVLELVCTPQRPTWPLSRLKPKVPAKLRQPFAEAVARRIQEQALPEAVGLLPGGKTPSLFLKRLPPPPPPDVALADKLLSVLKAQRTLGNGAYPLTLRRLLELAAVRPGATLLRKALARREFQAEVVIAKNNDPESPLALASDSERLAGSDLLLEYTLKSARTRVKHAFPPGGLAKKLATALREPFQAAVNRKIDAGSLSPAFGWVLNTSRLLFLMSDLNGGKATPAVPVPAANQQPARPTVPAGAVAQPPDFAGRFDDAFTRLDRQNGSHNFVGLADLRKALDVDRGTFDGGLHQLRRAGRYSLIDAEGRHAISPEERAAGIEEGGSLFLYVSRKAP